MRCIICHREIPDGSPFCNWCGHSQKETARRPRTRGNGTGTAYKRGKTWTAAVQTWIAGERVQKTKGGFPTKKAALDALPELRKRLLGYYDETAPVTVQELYDRWSTRHFNEITQGKAKSYTKAWERIARFRLRDIRALRYDEIQRVIDEAPGYYAQRDIRTVLNGIYQEAGRNQLQVQNLAELVQLRKTPEAAPDSFTAEEVAVMWDQLPRVPFLAYPLIMIYTGMRPGELRRLEPSMIDFDARLIRGAGEKTAQGKALPIPFPERLEPLLRSYESIAWRRDRTWFADQYRAALEAAGVRYLPPKACRSTCSTLLTLAGTPPAVIQRIMRHTSYKTTMTYYTALTLADEADALEKI